MTTPSNPENLAQLLQSVFGFASFRANQEAVCRAAIDGRDLLLVMPTGAGKSLCYQLPAIALGGTALVISPLIALMEDQVAKLAALSLRVARIHSGLDRSISRQACVDYLAGALDFLFIAPERLRVPGFPEMLAKRPPALIAIDEAHCISQWGHDFRPDYRMIGQYLPALRNGSDSVPVLALTATATPTVQADIIAQLGMINPARFIHGFRRHNLAIEVVELSVPQRPRAICGLLAQRDRRPAIVYATSRKQSESLAEELSQLMPAAAYHAGLDAETRERVQSAFQSGQLEVVVATIAFGMGIDKADIRTIIHAGLPGTLEGYYQEIGRAGRDGAPSRTFLMHSYADQRTHDFFLNRDYPPTDHLHQVFRMLGEDARPIDELRADFKTHRRRIRQGARETRNSRRRTRRLRRQRHPRRLRMEEDLLHSGPAPRRTIRKSPALHHIQRVPHVRPRPPLRRRRGCGTILWRLRYLRSRRSHPAPLPPRHQCRARNGAVHPRRTSSRRLQSSRLASTQSSIPPAESRATTSMPSLDAMSRAGLIAIEDAEYEKDGEVRRYRKVRLTESGLQPAPSRKSSLLLNDGIAEEFASPETRKRARKISKRDAVSTGNATNRTHATRRSVLLKNPPPQTLSADGEALAARLKEWRTSEAKRLRVPAYCVMHDRTLTAVAFARPTNPRQLLEIDGIGPTKVEKFGPAIIEICGAKLITEN